MGKYPPVPPGRKQRTRTFKQQQKQQHIEDFWLPSSTSTHEDMLDSAPARSPSDVDVFMRRAADSKLYEREVQIDECCRAAKGSKHILYALGITSAAGPQMSTASRSRIRRDLFITSHQRFAFRRLITASASSNGLPFWAMKSGTLHHMWPGFLRSSRDDLPYVPLATPGLAAHSASDPSSDSESAGTPPTPPLPHIGCRYRPPQHIAYSLRRRLFDDIADDARHGNDSDESDSEYPECESEFQRCEPDTEFQQCESTTLADRLFGPAPEATLAAAVPGANVPDATLAATFTMHAMAMIQHLTGAARALRTSGLLPDEA